MKHLKLLNYCKRMIKSTSAFGNANKGFASNELAQADKSVKDQAVKAGLIVVSGALLWTNGGVVREALAQQCLPGGYLLQSNDGNAYCNYNDGICWTHNPYEIPPDCQARYEQRQGQTNNSNGGFDVPTRQKPSSYGAVAWNLKKGSYGSASKQASKQLQTWRCKDVVMQVVRLQHGMQTNVWRLVMVCNLIKNICGNRHLV